MRRFRMRRTCRAHPDLDDGRRAARLAFFLCCLVLVQGFAGGVGADTDTQSAARPLAPQQRYDAARRLMQQGKFAQAAEGFRSVADAEDAPAPLRAQALMASALMHENNREYEQAAADYRETQRRFPGSEVVRRADAALSALEYGGAERGIAFRRSQDAAWDELFPAQAEAARGEWSSARPKLEAATRHLADILSHFRDHPKARDIAIALGNTHMLLEDFGQAQAAYTEAIAITREQVAAHGGGGPGLASLLLDAQERFAEAVRSWRRVWITRTSWAVLLGVAVALACLRPWREADAGTLALGLRLAATTLVLSAAAAAGSYVVRNYVDDHSPIEDHAAGLLVALPGMTAVLGTLGYALGLRATTRWSDTRIVIVAALVSALAAVAVAAIIINAFALFPILDSDL